jgi:hypothetical protein
VTPIVDAIAPGDRLHLGIDAVCGRHRVRSGRVSLNGALAHADIVAAPDAAPVALAGPLCLVQATVRVGAARHQVWGVVSWSDRGQPRMAAGLIDDAVSAGLEVVVERWDEVVAAVPEPSPPKRPRKKRARKPAPEEGPEIDLSPELAALDVRPAPEPPAPEPTPVPAPATGGWGAAVEASRKPSRPATASDLGFDVDGPPDLRAGDILLHPRFGRCRLVKVMGKGKVKVRRPTGGFFDLKVEVCTFSRQSDEDGKRVFRLKIGR